MSASSTLRIIEERVLAIIPCRVPQCAEFRLMRIRAQAGDGKVSSWHVLRVFQKNGRGEWALKQQLTLCGNELESLASALLQAGRVAS